MQKQIRVKRNKINSSLTVGEGLARTRTVRPSIGRIFNYVKVQRWDEQEFVLKTDATLTNVRLVNASDTEYVFEKF